MKNIVILIIIFSSMNVFSQTQALVTIEIEEIHEGTIKKELFGGFIEFLRNFINGPEGMWSQEFLNRGFDRISENSNGDIAFNWNKYYDGDIESKEWSMISGGYNENGQYAQKITNTGNGEIGIYQEIYIEDSVSQDFYVYLKGSTDNPVKLQIIDLYTDSILYHSDIAFPTNEWQKYEWQVPPMPSHHKVKAAIVISGKGQTEIDEISMMPSNNVRGIRKVVYDLYKEWKPGIYRYPGGWFADTKLNKLEHCIGPIDKRRSPNLGWSGHIQRMDFGLHEYMIFCNDLGIEPHITLNYGNGSPQTAREYVEYCNGSKDSEWGGKRAENGHQEPFDIKFFEIGNEQWGDPVEMSQKYLLFYTEITLVDNSIEVIIDGNHWNGQDNFNTIFNIVGTNCQLYGYHPTQRGTVDTIIDDELIYLSMVGGSHPDEIYHMAIYEELLFESELYPNCKQGLTEWWSDYGTNEDWLLDTNVRNSSLESGLYCASYLQAMMRYPRTMVMGERTIGLGLLRCRIHPETDARYFFGTPSYHALKMFRNHFGPKLIASDVKCNTYDVKVMHGLRWLDNVPFIDAVVSASNDSAFIGIINRYPKDETVIDFVMDSSMIGKQAKLYQLSGNHYLDANTLSNPHKITIKESNWITKNEILLPPHSVTIIAIPLNDTDEIPLEENNLMIYPSPVTSVSKVKFYLKDKAYCEMDIFDSIGKLVYKRFTGYLEAGWQELYLGSYNLYSGMYYLRLKINEKIILRPFVVLK